MATRTESELATNVLRSMGVLDAIEDASAADSAYVITRYRGLYEELDDDDMAYWDVDAIPVVVFESLTQYVAANCGQAYGSPMSPGDLDATLAILRRRIRKHTRMRSAEMPTVIEDFLMTIVPLELPTRSNQSRFGFEGAARIINGYSEPLGDDAKKKFALYPSEGVDLWLTASASGGIKCLLQTESYLYGVAGKDVFAIDVNDVITIMLTLAVEPDSAFMARNRRSPTTEVGLVANGLYYVITGTSIAAVTTNLIAPPTSIDSRDGYLILTQNFGRYQITAEDDATTLSLTDFGRAQRNPDEISRVLATETEIMLLSTDSIEWHANQPNELGAFPFVPVSQINLGLIGSKAAARIDRTICFVASDGTVRMVEGYGANRISTFAVERAIGGVTDKSTIECMAYNSTGIGHSFFAVSCPSFSWVYDLRTGEWAERESGTLGRWRVSHVVQWQGRIIAGDYATGKLYTLSGDYNTEAGEELAMTVQLPPLDAYPYRLQINALYVDLMPGTGLATGDTSDTNPRVMMSYSDDGGTTWSTERAEPVGTGGQTNTRVVFRRLGLLRRNGRTFRLSMSASVRRCLIGVAADVDKLAA